MKTWITCAILGALATLVQESIEPAEPLEIASGQRVTIAFAGEGEERVLTYRTQAPCSLFVWTQSDEVDVEQSVRRLDTNGVAEGNCVSGAAPAFIFMDCAAGVKFVITLGASHAGSAEFQLTEVPESEATRVADAHLREGLAAAKQLRASGAHPQAQERFRTTAGEYLEATDIPEDQPTLLTRGEVDALWDIAIASGEYGDREFNRDCFGRLVEGCENLRPLRNFEAIRTRWFYAIAHRNAGAIDEAQEQLKVVLQRLRPTSPREESLRINAFRELGKALSQLGRYAEAQEVIQEFLSDYSGAMGPTHEAILDGRTTLANIRLGRNDMAGARLIFRDVLRDLRSIHPALHINVLRMRGNLANSLAQFGKDRAALDAQRQLLADLESVSALGDSAELDRLDLSQQDLLNFSLGMRLNLAVTLSDLGQIEEAIPLFEEVLAERQRRLLEGHPDRSTARNLLANAYAQRGEYEEALVLALATLEQLKATLPLGHPRILGVRQTVLLSLMGLGRVEALEEQALDYAHGARLRLRGAFMSSARERTSVARATAIQIKALLVITAGTYDPRLKEATLALVEGVRVITGTSPRSFASATNKSPVLRQLDASMQAEHERLGEMLAARASGQPSGQQESNQLDIGAAIEARDSAERNYLAELAKEGLWYLKEIAPVDIAAALPEGSCAISFWRTTGSGLLMRVPGASGDEGEFFAQVLRADGRISTTRLGDGGEVLASIRNWRAAIGKPFPGDERRPAEFDPTAAGEALRALILDPVLPLLGDSSRIYVCLDDELHLVPLDALPLGDGFVGDRFDIRPLSFLSALVRPELTATLTGGLLAAGDVNYGSEEEATPTPKRASSDGLFETQFGALPQSGKEVRAIAELHDQTFDRDTVLLLGAEATKEAFLRLAPGVRYLHLATHGGAAIGLASLRPGDSVSERETIEAMAPLSLCGVAFANANLTAGAGGILTGEELSGLDLSGCELATFSACETSVGLHSAGQGLGSLQAALQAAGARTTLTSLWKVDDKWTRVLMVHFYQRLWSAEGVSPSTALWQAKSELRRLRAGFHNWAGWMLSGDLGS
ncbi:MAG: CHAT domain-containing protein/tetratricopeptide (TPR) repeat protein [Planctomycetota bacterium]|jgi:CHAT domain-containing protein/tetratricopeptide (TPR) repeat protein